MRILVKRKTFGLILILICILMLTACSSGPKDLTAGKTAETIVEESFDKWYQLSNYDMDMQTNMSMSMGQEVMDLSMIGKITVFQNPMKMKMVMDANIPGLADNVQMEQYMIEEDQKVVLYQKIQGQWQKVVVDDPAMVEMMAMDPRDNLKLFMDNLTKTEIIGEEKIGEKDTVKVDLVASSKIFEQVFQDTAGSSLGVSSDLISADILSKIGDLKYMIWIDKATLETVKCQMDLSENMQNLANAWPEDQEMMTELKEAFKNMKMSMEYSITNQNAAADFTIPEEAKNAEEIAYGNP